MVTQDLWKAGIQGAGLAGITRLMTPAASVRVNLFGQVIPLWFLAGLGGAASSLVGDFIHDQVLPHIPKNKKYMTMETAILSPALVAATYLGLMYVYNPAIITVLGPLQLGSEAVAADIGAQYLVQNFL